jgi:predicted GNAT family acetyltransferase
MELRDHETVDSFLEAASPLLALDEARHNLAFGICHTLAVSPATYPVFHLWTVEHGNEVTAAALMTPPFNLLVSRPSNEGALEFLAQQLQLRGLDLPGVTGALPEVDEFADTWERLAGVRRRLRVAQGIYAIRDVRVPSGVAGEMRRATKADRELLLGWMEAFVAEALGEDAHHGDLNEIVERRLSGRTGGLALWVDGGPVSMAGFGGQTPHGIRIGPVYTPPPARRRGYGSALTAELSRALLGDGREYCFLYTDLANPTSNRIYRNIGYELVCESAEYAFAGS